MRFPVAEAVSQERFVLPPGMPPGPKGPLGGIFDMTPAYVACDSVGAWYFQSEKPCFDWDDGDFGVIKPPFPLMWFEWEPPEWGCLAGKVEKVTRNGRIGSFVRDAEGFVEVVSWIWVDTLPMPLLFPATQLVGYDENGLYAPDCFAGVASTFGTDLLNKGTLVLLDPSFTVDQAKMYRDAIADPVKVALLAISFMHCRNVRTDWVEVPPKVAAKRARMGGVQVDRHAVIHLPSTTSSRSSRADRRAALGSPMSPHWVRGHFKTYTPDAPLLGKHVGSWWWQPNVRGLKDGEGPKPRDYEVSPA